MILKQEFLEFYGVVDLVERSYIFMLGDSIRGLAAF